MRHPRMSPRGKLVIGTMPSAVVCTGNGWDELTDTRKRRVPSTKTSSPARSRDRARATAKPTDWTSKLIEARRQWEAAEPGAPKREALKRVRYLEIKCGLRDAAGKSIEIDYMGETWANNAA